MPVVIPADLKQYLGRVVPPKTRPATRKILQERFQKVKEEAIAEFLTHPVSVELMGGPETYNVSGTLGGVSNLFAFIGFDANEDPLTPILDLLNKTRLTFVKNSAFTNEYAVNFPTADEIFSKTPMPWAAGRSWAKGIETEIAGFGHLLRVSDDPYSRSGQALQSRVKIRDSQFSPIDYISAFVDKYRKRFEQLK